MAELETRLRRLEDAEAIRNLVARYGPLADAGQSEAVAALWTEDGEYVIGGFGIKRGRAEVASAIDSPFHRQLMSEGCAHLLTPPAVDLDGDRAIAINHSFVGRCEGDDWRLWRVSANRWELVRTEEGWRVARRINQPIDRGDEARNLFSTTGFEI